MRFATAIMAALLAVTVQGADNEARTITFSKDDVGKAPRGWKVEKTGVGEGNVWQVAADNTAPSKSGHVLAQTAKGPSRLFNMCILGDGRYKDVEATVHIKSVKGDIDQGGGLVWRYQDANNYYICRYNPLEENFRLYKVVDGKRTQLQSKEMLVLPDDKWFKLTIRQKGDAIECSINGQKLLEAKDPTFPNAGRVGMWTKADAVTYFDGLKVQER